MYVDNDTCGVNIVTVNLNYKYLTNIKYIQKDKTVSQIYIGIKNYNRNHR